MAVFKVVWEFTETTAATFTEVFYVERNSAIEATGTALDTINRRRNLLAPIVTLNRIRASNVAQLRDTAVRVINLTGNSIDPSGAAAPESCVVIQMAGASGGQRHLWLRGVPAGLITRNRASGRDEPTAQLTQAISDLMSAYNTEKYGIRRLQQTTKFPITLISGALTPGQTILTIAAAGAVPPPPANTLPRVVISGTNAKQFPRLNGHWSSLSWDGTHLTLNYVMPGPNTVTGQWGFMRQETYQAVSIIDVARSQFAYFGSHDTKNPLSRSRGARRAARVRASV